MAKATDKTTPPRRYGTISPPPRYNEEARKKLRQHIERVAARRGNCSGVVDFDALWENLEIAALSYDPNDPLIEKGRDSLSARGTLEELILYRGRIKDLIRNCLQKRELFAWGFVSEDGCWLNRGPSKSFWPALECAVSSLTAVCEDMEAGISELQRFAGEEGRTKALDAGNLRVPLQGLVLNLGQQIFGPGIGNKDGPLLTFMRLALEPVLGVDTPSAAALRKFARTQQKIGG